MHFLLSIYCIPIEISQKLAHVGPINNVTALVKMMAQCQTAPCHYMKKNDSLVYWRKVCVTWPEWINDPIVHGLVLQSVSTSRCHCPRGSHFGKKLTWSYTRTVSRLSKITYWISEIRQLSTFRWMKRMFVWFHANFIFYESTDPPYLLTNESFQPIINGRN